MGLTAGPVPARVDASVKAGLLDLVDHATGSGWSRRKACRLLGLDEMRASRWAARREAERLTDAMPGGAALHAILDSERAAICDLFATWGDIDRSHRKLAARGSRVDMVHVSASTLRRVLADEQLIFPGKPAREPVPRSGWPDWLEWRPNRIWGYDFTHFTRAKSAVIAIIDIVSRKWVATVCSREETSTQVEIAFRQALQAEDLWEAADTAASDELITALVSGHTETLDATVDAGHRPLLLAISDNGPQMRSHTTREFLAGIAIARHFGRPGVPQDQAWIESLFGHIKGEWPHLEKIRDAGELATELQTVRQHYNTVRLHAAIGYVTPDDEHTGRGDAIRDHRQRGLARARANRIQYHRNNTKKKK